MERDQKKKQEKRYEKSREETGYNVIKCCRDGTRAMQMSV